MVYLDDLQDSGCSSIKIAFTHHIWARHDVQLPFIYVPFDSVQPNWKARNTGDKQIKKVILPESTSEKRIDFLQKI